MDVVVQIEDKEAEKDKKYENLREDSVTEEMASNTPPPKIRTLSGRFIILASPQSDGGEPTPSPSADGEAGPSEVRTSYECPVCFESHSDPQLLHVLSSCSHAFCVSCTQGQLESNIKSAQVPVGCLAPKCDKKFLDSEVQRLVSDDLFTRYQRFLTKKENPSVPECPYCGKLQTPAPGTPAPSAVVMNCNECKKEFCRIHGSRHPGLTCDVYLAARDPAEIAAEAAADQVISQISKPCPHCRFAIEKERGTCDHVRCTRCGNDFCFKCLNPNLTGKYNRTCANCKNSFIDHQYMPLWRFLAVLLFPLWVPLALLWFGLIFVMNSCFFCCVIVSCVQGKPVEVTKAIVLLLFLPFVFVASYTGLTQCVCLMPEEVRKQMESEG